MLEPLLSQLKAFFAGTGIAPRDGGSLRDLDANIRSAAFSVRTAQTALAKAKAEQAMDRKRLRQLNQTIEDLENRARNALLKGAEQLAREAAEAIAVQEDERAALETSILSFDQDLLSLTDQLHRTQARLRALKRGERTAEVREQIHRAQSLGTGAGQSALSRAEEQLEEISEHQERNQLADREYAALSPADKPDALIEKLADAGCGTPVRTQAEDVLARLKADMPLMIQQQH
ncbi:MAG: PspA/IM30 family protein [Pseudomonadota bacterium]